MRNNQEFSTRRFSWSPDGTLLLLHMNSVDGGMNAVINLQSTVDSFFWRHPFQDATWSVDGRAMIVSGQQIGNGIILGRVHITEPDQRFEGYAYSGVTFIRAATEVFDGQLAFLGSVDGVSWSLYIMPIGGIPTPVTEPVFGQVRDWDWNPGRSALRVILETDEGRRLWRLQTNGSIRDEGRAPDSAHWR
jgi:hypothetical protein